MAAINLDSLAQRIHNARIGGNLLDIPPREELPGDSASAYDVQNRLIALLGEAPRAWKLGAPAKAAQAALGLTEPFSGPVLPGMLLASPAAVDAAGFACHVFEPEIAIMLGQDISDQIDAAQAREAIASLHPAIEIIGFRFREGRSLDALGMVTDYGANGGLVLGGASKAKVDDYWNLPLEVRINGESVAQRSAPHPETDLAQLLAWFSGHISSRGLQLKKGDVITTGSQAGVIAYSPGDLVEADFGPAGIASVQF